MSFNAGSDAFWISRHRKRLYEMEVTGRMLCRAAHPQTASHVQLLPVAVEVRTEEDWNLRVM